MPRYDFTCEKCELTFEIRCSMSEITDLKPKCPTCGKKKCVVREFNADIYCAGPTITVGSLVDKNTSRMSADERNHLHEKHNEYRKQPYTGPQPIRKE